LIDLALRCPEQEVQLFAFITCSNTRGDVTYRCFKYYISSSAWLQQVSLDVRYKVPTKSTIGTSSITGIW
jgi:hypothetical protein